MIKVGLLGAGVFGKKILEKLKNIDFISIEWVLSSKDKWWEYGNIDWVIIATPNEFHFEQSVFFLKNNVNVFCEKPAAFTMQGVEDLIRLANKNKCKFYVDDVLIYENIKKQNDFLCKKAGGTASNIIDRIAYHHFYLIYNPSLGFDFNTKIYINNLLHKKFTLEFKNKLFHFEYDFEWYREEYHNIVPQSKKDALEEMLSKVLENNVNFEENHNRALFATHLCYVLKKQLYGTCAVIGGGIYGITSAIKLAVAGYNVDLYEAQSDILQSASGINQYRVHRGYHYPRSKETILSCKNGQNKFIKYYRRCILDEYEHFYSIAEEDSLTSPSEYLSILDEVKLEWRVVEKQKGCAITLQVNENLFDNKILYDICKERTKGVGIKIFTNNRIQSLESLKDYSHIVIATYANLNDLDSELNNYQFELCEKPLFRLPDIYKNKSIVVIDGPFMCFDPFSNTEFHLGGNVVHAIHNTNIGKLPDIPHVFKEYLNKGIIENPKITNAKMFIHSAKKFFPAIEKAQHIGSMFTIRTVLPNKDKTDERPTIIRSQKNAFVIFSGKIANCVQAADNIITEIKKNN
jgi:hypothetical protein